MSPGSFTSTIIQQEIQKVKCINPNILIKDSTGKFVFAGNIQKYKNQTFDNKKHIIVGCKHCYYCRLKHSKEIALRCENETKSHTNNWFITLTYDNDNIKNINRYDFQQFIKKLRRYFDYHNNEKNIKVFYCGEYGERTKRPHFHAIIFGADFKKFENFKIFKNGKNTLYISDILTNTWAKGYTTIAKANYTTARYVASYCQKARHNSNTSFEPIFGISNGIGKNYCLQNIQKIITNNYLRSYSGIKHAVPQYYKKIIKQTLDNNTHINTLINEISSEKNNYCLKKLTKNAKTAIAILKSLNDNTNYNNFINYHIDNMKHTIYNINDLITHLNERFIYAQNHTNYKYNSKAI